jgi:transcription initiation factor TFIIH subunit 2
MAKSQIEFTVPPYAHKEILIINSSITNCDPDNIYESIESLKNDGIICSVISLSASIHILKTLTNATEGAFYLAKNKDHYQQILLRYLVPHFSKKEMQAQQEV